MAQIPGCLPAPGRPGLYSRYLALAWPTPAFCGHLMENLFYNENELIKNVQIPTVLC